MITLAVVILLASFPLTALAQTVDDGTSTESNWQPTFAEPPSKPAVKTAGMEVEVQQIKNNNYLCYWAKVADESVWETTFHTMAKSVNSDDAYSGDKVFTRDGSAWGQQTTTWKLEVEVSGDAMPSAELMFLRFQYRGTNVEPWDKIHVNSIRGPWQVVDEQVQTGYAGEGWRQWERVFEPLPMDQRQNLRVWMTHDSDDDSSYELDQVGIGYCVNADNLQPEISQPGEIGALFSSILLFGGQLVNHGSSAISVLDPKGLRSFENLWNSGEAFQVLNRKFAAGCSPFGMTEGLKWTP